MNKESKDPKDSNRNIDQLKEMPHRCLVISKEMQSSVYKSNCTEKAKPVCMLAKHFAYSSQNIPKFPITIDREKCERENNDQRGDELSGRKNKPSSREKRDVLPEKTTTKGTH